MHQFITIALSETQQFETGFKKSFLSNNLGRLLGSCFSYFFSFSSFDLFWLPSESTVHY